MNDYWKNILIDLLIVVLGAIVLLSTIWFICLILYGFGVIEAVPLIQKGTLRWLTQV